MPRMSVRDDNNDVNADVIASRPGSTAGGLVVRPVDVTAGTASPTTVGASTDGDATELLVAATVAAASNDQTLGAAAGKRTYIQGFLIGGLGATAASVITIGFTGLADADFKFRFSVPAGATAIAPQLLVQFERPIPASADNTAIVVTVPSFGAGNTAADAAAWGFRI